MVDLDASTKSAGVVAGGLSRRVRRERSRNPALAERVPTSSRCAGSRRRRHDDGLFAHPGRAGLPRWRSRAWPCGHGPGPVLDARAPAAVRRADRRGHRLAGAGRVHADRSALRRMEAGERRRVAVFAGGRRGRGAGRRRSRRPRAQHTRSFAGGKSARRGGVDVRRRQIARRVSAAGHARLAEAAGSCGGEVRRRPCRCRRVRRRGRRHGRGTRHGAEAFGNRRESRPR